MRRGRIPSVLLLLEALVLIAAGSMPTHPVRLPVPKDWPAPTYDLSRNPLTEEGIALGRKLFYDPILSRDSMISCASCHLSYTAFSHVDHKLSHGIHDSIGTRNAPALMNLAWSKSFMWDGAVNHLDVQPLAPINHPAEMGETTQRVVSKLERSPTYRRLFALAFGDSTIRSEGMLKALAQFQLSLVSAGSHYDRVKAGTERFTDQEQRGYALFLAHCDACHREPLFTTGEFANNGLRPDRLLRDGGRILVTHAPIDSLKFKIPTLRNIEFSFPYMHDGRFRSLHEVLRHYTNDIVPSATLASELRSGIQLSADERTDLIAFLLTLSDREFCFNPEHAFPRP